MDIFIAVLIVIFILSTFGSLFIYWRILKTDPFIIIQMHVVGWLMPFIPGLNTFLVLDTLRLYVQDKIKKWRNARRPVMIEATIKHRDRDINSLYPNKTNVIIQLKKSS